MIIFPFLIVFVVALILTGLLRHYALKYKLLDIPNPRSSHELPTPRGGGMAIVATFLFGLTIAWYLDIIERDLYIALTGAGGVVAAIGFLDDHGHVSARWRLMIHFVAAFWALWWLGEPPPIQLSDVIFHGEMFAAVVAAVFLVWLLNLFNFMDGIDGLAGSEAAFITISGAIFTWLVGSQDVAFVLLMLTLATLGFLSWNWPPAKIFMGDVGSGFLGITLGILAYASALGGVSLWSWLILFGVFLVDASITLFTRILRRTRWYEAHCSHAYQWAARKWGHLRVSIAVNLINLLWLLPLAYFAYIYPHWGWLIMLVAFTPLIIITIMLGAGRSEENSTRIKTI